MKKMLICLLLPLTCFGVVTQGPGDTYSVDKWGSPMRPTKDEMGIDTKTHLNIHDQVEIPVSFKSHFAIPVK